MSFLTQFLPLRRTLVMSICGFGAASALSPFVVAECPCQQRVNAAGPMTPVPMPTTMPSYSNAPTDPYIAVPQPQIMASPPPMPAHGAMTTNPGGFRYFRTTRMIPASKPPRVAMLDVYTNPEAKVHVYDIHPFREQDEISGYHDVKNANLWVFETKTLLPGLSHIYKVVSTDPEGVETIKFVRLVPGRIVDVEF